MTTYQNILGSLVLAALALLVISGCTVGIAWMWRSYRTSGRKS